MVVVVVVVAVVLVVVTLLYAPKRPKRLSGGAREAGRVSWGAQRENPWNPFRHGIHFRGFYDNTLNIIYIYIYIERERERYIHIYIYIYNTCIYIYIYTYV